MGIYLRKSIRFGKHFKLNLSKSGIGFSTGIRGLRVGKSSTGKAYVSGGRKGLYFRNTLNTKQNTNKTEIQPVKVKNDHAILKFLAMIIGILFLIGLAIEISPLLILVGIIFVVVKIVKRVKLKRINEDL